jgi:site-specific DNA recombinase
MWIMKRVALYARVSTDRQEREETIDSQLEQLRLLAGNEGLAVLDRHVYIDEGYSGDALARPGMDRLRDDVRDGLLDVVMIHHPDRLARRYAYQVVIIEEMEKYGCELHFVNRPIADTPEDRMLLEMQGVIAEYERAKILERTRRGRLYKARMGILSIGNAPYGYRRIAKQGTERARIEIDEEQAGVVRSIFRWAGEEGLSILAVTRRLMHQHVPAPRGGSRWGKSAVGNILRNRAYIGEFCCNRWMAVEPTQPKKGPYRRRRKSSQRLRPSEEWIVIPVPAVVDRGHFEAVRKRLEKNKQFALRHCNPTHQCLLRCLLRCGICGYSMVANGHGPAESKLRYYKCRKHWQPEQYGDGNRCPMPTIHAMVLDDIVWRDLCDLLADPERIMRYGGLNDEENDDLFCREEDRLSRETKACDRQLKRLLDAYQHDALEVDDLLRRRKALVERKRILIEELKRIQKTRAEAGTRSALRARIPDLVRHVQIGLQASDFETRQQLVRLLVERVVVMPNLDVEIHYHLPLSGIHAPRPPAGNGAAGPPHQTPPVSGENVSGNFQLRPQPRAAVPLRASTCLLAGTPEAAARREGEVSASPPVADAGWCDRAGAGTDKVSEASMRADPLPRKQHGALPRCIGEPFEGARASALSALLATVSRAARSEEEAHAVGAATHARS